jgi:hypothetical protein
MNMTSLLKVSPATRFESKSGQFAGRWRERFREQLHHRRYSRSATSGPDVLNGNNNLPFQFVQEIQIKTSRFRGRVRRRDRWGDQRRHPRWLERVPR